MFMVIGKKEASRMIISFGVSPRPNQRISREIIAIGGAFRKKFPIKRKYSATPGAYALMTAHRNASVKEIVNPVSTLLRLTMMAVAISPFFTMARKVEKTFAGDGSR